LNFWRSSALSMTSARAPIIWTPKRSSTPRRTRSMAVFRPVWPPRVGSRASGRSRSVILATTSAGGGSAEGGAAGCGSVRMGAGAVGGVGVGHDGGGVGVDQDDLVALLAQGLAGLGAAVVELARLADDDRPRADEQDLLQVGTLWHVGLFSPLPSGGEGRRAA